MSDLPPKKAISITVDGSFIAGTRRAFTIETYEELHDSLEILVKVLEEVYEMGLEMGLKNIVQRNSQST